MSMVVTMGVIDCTCEDTDTISSMVEHWFSTYEEHSYIKEYNLKIVPSSYENFYGGVKVGFFTSVKKSWDIEMHEQVIKNFESLMSALPFSSAILYLSSFDYLIEWFLNTDENIEFYTQNNGIIEKTDNPNICRVTRTELRNSKSVKLFDFQ